MRTSPVGLACLTCPEALEDVFNITWVGSSMCSIIYKVGIILWAATPSSKYCYEDQIRRCSQMCFVCWKVLHKCDFYNFLLFRYSNGVSPEAKMGATAGQEWARWAALLNCLVCLRTKMSGCVWQLLLDVFKFMALQQGRSVHRGGVVEACTIYNAFNVFGNWVIVSRTGGRWEWLTRGIKPWLHREFHLRKLQWLIQTMKYLVLLSLFIVEN